MASSANVCLTAAEPHLHISCAPQVMCLRIATKLPLCFSPEHLLRTDMPDFLLEGICLSSSRVVLQMLFELLQELYRVEQLGACSYGVEAVLQQIQRLLEANDWELTDAAIRLLTAMLLPNRSNAARDDPVADSLQSGSQVHAAPRPNRGIGSVSVEGRGSQFRNVEVREAGNHWKLWTQNECRLSISERRRKKKSTEQ